MTTIIVTEVIYNKKLAIISIMTSGAKERLSAWGTHVLENIKESVQCASGRILPV